MIKTEKTNEKMLRAKWTSLWKHFNEANKQLRISFSNGISEADKIKMREFMKRWDALCSEVCGFYEAIDNFSTTESRVTPVELTLPWTDGVFSAAWNNWVAYMDEQFGIKLSSRSLEQRLAILKQMSEGDETKAVAIINHAIANTYKAFYKLGQEETQDGKTKTQKRKDDDFSE